MTDTNEKRPVSPVNGQPLPRGKPFTSETARQARQKRTKAEADRRSIAESFRLLVSEMQTDKNGKQMSGAEVIARSIMKCCVNGNVKAQELALALMGEKPAETVNINTPDPAIMEEIRRRMEQDG